MNKEIKKQWIAALRSGEYKQGKGQLVTNYNEYCCLGVLSDLALRAGIANALPPGGKYLAYPTVSWAGFSLFEDDIEDELATLNDNGKTFCEIADVIERNEFL